MQNSQLPAESRMNQIMQRLNDGAEYLGQTNVSQQINGNTQLPYSPENFKAVVSLMQSQMLSQSLLQGNDENSNNSFLGGGLFGNSMLGGNMDAFSLMGMNPHLMAITQQQGYGSPQQIPYYNQQNLLNQSPTYTDPIYSAEFPIQGGSISSHFGERSDPTSQASHALDSGHEFHKGVDIAAPKGTPIKSPWEGEVVYVGYADGFGPKTVIIAHHNTMQKDGKILYSVFGHNEDVMVQAGDTVTRGQVFATVGSEGHSTGPHLHWETRLAEPGLYGRDVFKDYLSMAIDPLKFV